MNFLLISLQPPLKIDYLRLMRRVLYICWPFPLFQETQKECPQALFRVI
jgi:hypothetical protein